MDEDTPLEIPLEPVPDHHPNPAQRSAPEQPEEEIERAVKTQRSGAANKLNF